MTPTAMLDTPQNALKDLEVKSFVPGRLRIKSPTLFALPQAPLVLNGIAACGTADSIKISQLTQSVLIQYDCTKYSKRSFIKTLLSSLGLSAVAIAATEEKFLPQIISAEVNTPPQSVDRARPEQTPSATLSAKLLSFLGLNGGGASSVTKQKEAPSATISPAERSALQELTWVIKSDTPGRLRMHHPLVRQYAIVAQKVELTLVNLDGVTDYSVSGITANTLVKYDGTHLTRDELLEIVSEAVQTVVRESELAVDKSLRQVSLSSANMVFAGVATAFPPLLPVAALTTLVVSGHIFIGAFKAIFVHRKIKVDILDAIVIAMGLAFNQVFLAALMVFVVDIGYTILDVTSKTSHKLLARVFGKQARKAWLVVDGQEVECKVSDLRIGATIVIGAGEQIPVDGVVADGDAMVDQHALTGESAPVEKTAGEKVFAMTVVLAGRIFVRVSETGENTNAAKIVKIIEHSMEHKVRLQSTAEKIADIMVLPTLGLGAAGLAFVGPGAMMAIINADYGTGIRIAGPTALLASLSLAAKNGIIIKNGGKLESLCQMEAVIFDKTGTLTQETPVVGNIIACDGAFSEEEILAYVACAEQRFSHPIAKAIVQRAAALNLELPTIDESSYHVGFGIQVQINGASLKAGSMRYMERENITIPSRVSTHLEGIHKEGRSAVFAAVDERLVGVIELQASSRPEAYQVIETLRKKRGIQEIYLISGDHQAATRALAERLGINHYFAEVLPQDKAKYVKKLQERGLKVTMVGDGINDSVALTQADYSVSLRGASDIATDVADVVFMDGGLAKFDLLFQISENLRKNVRRSFGLIVVPNTICILGAFMGVVGLGTSVLLNNGFNTIATINGFLPYYSVMEELDLEQAKRGV